MCGPNDDMTNPANLDIYVPQRDESGRLDAERARVGHLEREHGYRFGDNDDPEATPYAIRQLHQELHQRGYGHE